jgi:GGDEF domain-containing protein
LGRTARALEPQGALATNLAAVEREWETGDHAAAAPTVLRRLSELGQELVAAVSDNADRAALDMREVLHILNQALQSVAHGGEQSLSCLQMIETDLVRASQLDDVVALKTRLRGTMEFVREQATRQKEHQRATLSALDQGAGRLRRVLERSGDGLPGPQAAEARLRDLAASPAAAGLAVVAARLDRLAGTASRYGEGVAQEVLFAFIQPLRQQCFEETLYHWAGDTLLWFARVEESVQHLRVHYEERFHATFEHRLMVNGRRVRLSLPVGWMCAGLAEHPAGETLSQLERFRAPEE